MRRTGVLRGKQLGLWGRGMFDGVLILVCSIGGPHEKNIDLLAATLSELYFFRWVGCLGKAAPRVADSVIAQSSRGLARGWA